MDWIAMKLGDVGENTEPVLDRILADYETLFRFYCEDCRVERSFPIKGTFRNQIYEDEKMGAAREIAILQMDSQKLLQCLECDCIYTLSVPKPVYERVVHGDIDMQTGESSVPKISSEYDVSKLEEDVAESVKQISINKIGVPFRF